MSYLAVIPTDFADPNKRGLFDASQLVQGANYSIEPEQVLLRDRTVDIICAAIRCNLMEELRDLKTSLNGRFYLARNKRKNVLDCRTRVQMYLDACLNPDRFANNHVFDAQRQILEHIPHHGKVITSMFELRTRLLAVQVSLTELIQNPNEEYKKNGFFEAAQSLSKSVHSSVRFTP